MRWVLVLLAILMAAPAGAGTLNLRLGEETISHVADLPAGGVFELGGEPAALGWLHREYSILDAPFAVFGERGFVLYRAEGLRRDYVLLTDVRLAEMERLAGADWRGSPPLSLWQRHGGLFAVVGLALVLALRAVTPGRPRRPVPMPAPFRRV